MNHKKTIFIYFRFSCQVKNNPFANLILYKYLLSLIVIVVPSRTYFKMIFVLDNFQKYFSFLNCSFLPQIFK